MTIPLRTLDELYRLPHLATLPALSACIDAFSVALEIAHPNLFLVHPTLPRDAAAFWLRVHLDECHQLLRAYDRLTFDEYEWDDDGTAEQDGAEPDDLIPF